MAASEERLAKLKREAHEREVADYERLAEQATTIDELRAQVKKHISNNRTLADQNGFITAELEIAKSGREEAERTVQAQHGKITGMQFGIDRHHSDVAALKKEKTNVTIESQREQNKMAEKLKANAEEIKANKKQIAALKEDNSRHIRTQNALNMKELAPREAQR